MGGQSLACRTRTESRDILFSPCTSTIACGPRTSLAQKQNMQCSVSARLEDVIFIFTVPDPNCLLYATMFAFRTTTRLLRGEERCRTRMAKVQGRHSTSLEPVLEIRSYEKTWKANSGTTKPNETRINRTHRRCGRPIGKGIRDWRLHRFAGRRGEEDSRYSTNRQITHHAIGVQDLVQSWAVHSDLGTRTPVNLNTSINRSGLQE